MCEDDKPLPQLSSWLQPRVTIRGGLLSHFSCREENSVLTTRGAFPLRGARFTTALTSLLPFPFPGLSSFIFGWGKHQQRFLSK